MRTSNTAPRYGYSTPITKTVCCKLASMLPLWNKLSRIGSYKFKVYFYFILCKVIGVYILYKYRTSEPGRQPPGRPRIALQLNKLQNPAISINLYKDPKIRFFNQKKYILLWTKSKYLPFTYFGEGNTVFVDKKCEWTNCYVTDDRNYLGKYTEFDVVAFNGPQLSMHVTNEDLPEERGIHQKYVYANIEAAGSYPVREARFEGYFNWTWTYRLDSDALWGYVAVRDAGGRVVGPRRDAHWLAHAAMEPVDRALRLKLDRKTKAAAWFSTNCHTGSNREAYAKKIKQHLKQYGLQLDIFGKCGPSKCPKTIMKRCLHMLKRHYHFYLAFENSFNEDYVTEKLVYALKHNTVPIVYGGANYTRFMPDGIYLDARTMSPSELAKTMHEIIQNKTRYYEFFRWKKHYSYSLRHERPDTDDYCNFCRLANNDTLMKTTSVYQNFSLWWNGDETAALKLERFIDLAVK